ncbi:unnamed protein product [Chrysodeixis includens]|uniref:Peptidase S1 domain-containing protein n=1 Tax=Chrysodeixis includens TaxID=689277 RepID=A0A9N8KS87_CHRIL|nr:unnamed protein product [Chrysodeixis includens]
MNCHKCVKTAECAAYGNLSKLDQDAWQLKYPCTASGDEQYSKLFGFANAAKGDFVCCSEAIANASSTAAGVSVDSRHPEYNSYYPNYNNPNGYNPNTYNPNNYNPNTYNPNGQNPGYYDQGNNRQPSNGWDNNYGYNPSQGNPPYGGYDQGMNRQPPNNYYNGNGNGNGNGNSPYGTQNPFYGNGGNGQGNMGGITNQGGQCPVTSFAPKPETGCCGREATDSDRIIGRPNPNYVPRPNPYDNSRWPSYNNRLPSYNSPMTRVARSAAEALPTVTIDDRIAGGRETELEQFPWLVLLLVTFDDGNKRSGFNCGGSLISNKFVLTAGHCVFEKGSRVAEPICLPSIDIDNPDFFNLRLAVAGWGRNGRYRSDIKQSTIVNLVPQEKCQKYYPNLSRRQMCAAGYSGEDTCKGDSGGPLMTMYGGKYEVVGVVSGKRADAPCGTSVPSLYTSVYNYREWIESSMMQNSQ